MPLNRQWPFDQALQLACLLEAAAPKLGNVHPGASFHDMHYAHFAASAIAIRSAFEQPMLVPMSTKAGGSPNQLAASLSATKRTMLPEIPATAASHDDWGVGSIVLAAARAVRQQVGRNTNLGTLLLFAPIAVAHWHGASSKPEANLQSRLVEVLGGLSATDSRLVYEAIRVARPGGLGSRDVDDVNSSAPDNLLNAMRQVAQWDAIARQYTNGFHDVFLRLVPWLREEVSAAADRDPLDAICRLQIRWLAHEPDGLIIRKVGLATAQQVQVQARQVWEELQGFSGTVGELPAAKELDGFLRSDSNRLNPGTTADLIAAALLVRLLDVRYTDSSQPPVQASSL